MSFDRESAPPAVESFWVLSVLQLVVGAAVLAAKAMAAGAEPLHALAPSFFLLVGMAIFAYGISDEHGISDQQITAVIVGPAIAILSIFWSCFLWI
jgi:hypothetical protein